jgi:hypothetical protein
MNERSTEYMSGTRHVTPSSDRVETEKSPSEPALTGIQAAPPTTRIQSGQPFV